MIEQCDPIDDFCQLQTTLAEQALVDYGYWDCYGRYNPVQQERFDCPTEPSQPEDLTRKDCCDEFQEFLESVQCSLLQKNEAALTGDKDSEAIFDLEMKWLMSLESKLKDSIARNNQNRTDTVKCTKPKIRISPKREGQKPTNVFYILNARGQLVDLVDAEPFKSEEPKLVVNESHCDKNESSDQIKVTNEAAVDSIKEKEQNKLQKPEECDKNTSSLTAEDKSVKDVVHIQKLETKDAVSLITREEWQAARKSKLMQLPITSKSSTLSTNGSIFDTKSKSLISVQSKTKCAEKQKETALTSKEKGKENSNRSKKHHSGETKKNFSISSIEKSKNKSGKLEIKAVSKIDKRSATEHGKKPVVLSRNTMVVHPRKHTSKNIPEANLKDSKDKSEKHHITAQVMGAEKNKDSSDTSKTSSLPNKTDSPLVQPKRSNDAPSSTQSQLTEEEKIQKARQKYPIKWKEPRVILKRINIKQYLNKKLKKRAASDTELENNNEIRHPIVDKIPQGGPLQDKNPRVVTKHERSVDGKGAVRKSSERRRSSDRNKPGRKPKHGSPKKDKLHGVRWHIPKGTTITPKTLDQLRKGPKVILEKLKLDDPKVRAAVLANVPGMRDLHLMQPERNEPVVQVVQVPGGEFKKQPQVKLLAVDNARHRSTGVN